MFFDKITAFLNKDFACAYTEKSTVQELLLNVSNTLH